MNKFIAGRGIPMIVITIENGELVIYAQRKTRLNGPPSEDSKLIQ